MGRSLLTLAGLVCSVVIAAATPAHAIPVGPIHSCAIGSADRLYCWGDDSQGQVGDGGTNADRTTPKQITAATDWTTVAPGGLSTCAIRSVGKLYCWGADYYGQLGDGGTNAPRTTPKRITEATDWKTVAGSVLSTCAIRATGKLYCWGDDYYGQLGDGGANTGVQNPRQITAATDWKTVAVGYFHTCAIRSVGKLYCWGEDSNGQVGDGPAVDNPTTPKQITAATDWKSVAAGYRHTCAIRSTGKLYCWGEDSNGQIGNGVANANVQTPQQITAATDWTSVALGLEFTCAIRSTGKLYCWGDDSNGQIGNGVANADVQTPQQITTATDWKALAAGSFHSCATRPASKFYCWGEDGDGQVGDGGANTDVQTPRLIALP